MNVAIWLLSAVLALPIAEIVVFVLVAAAIGFLWALLAVALTSLAGAAMLRHGGGAHVARMRVVLGPQRATAFEADSAGMLYLLAAILLLIPGFITDVLGLVLLVPPLRRAAAALFRRAMPRANNDNVVDLDPDDWRRVGDPQLRDHREPPR
jgi:UPF0716 protein FxsA